jgi:hypothetical protein
MGVECKYKIKTLSPSFDKLTNTNPTIFIYKWVYLIANDDTLTFDE